MDLPNVLVVGAGPTGLMLACQLARHGVHCRLIDSKTGPTQESRTTVLSPRCMEVFEQLGIAEELLNSAVVIDRVDMYTNGKHRIVMDVGRDEQMFTRFMGGFVVNRSEIDRILMDAFRELGGSVDWGVTFRAMTPSNGKRLVSLQNEDDSIEERTFDWVCGCDGPRSAVRHALNVPFAGMTYDESFYVADVDVHSQLLPRDRGTLFVSDKGFLHTVPMRSDHGQRQRLLGVVPTEAAKEPGWLEDPDFPGVISAIRNVTGHDLKFGQVHEFTTYTVQQRMVGTFQKGRVLLVGAATHIHPFARTHGINTGLLDAHNLGWKLALVVCGIMQPFLVITYGREREPVVRRFLAKSGALLHIMMSNHWLATFFRCYILRLILRLTLALPRMRSALFRSLSHIGISYRANSFWWNHFCGNKLRAGDRFPSCQLLADGISVDSASLLRPPNFYVLDFSSQRGEEARKCITDLDFKFPISYHSCEAIKGCNLVVDAVCFIRPDMHVAIAGEKVTRTLLLEFVSSAYF